MNAMTTSDFWIALSIIEGINVIAGLGFLKWLDHQEKVTFIIQEDVKKILRLLPVSSGCPE